ncbi:MAG: hypothetical protein H6836_06615 [Planctomycetes bacterium]|nr:hypothetical protein [Planctomycetota bacterium]MCB9889232.1 hypothetical protein [Planctomycetota bacterium]
MILLRSAMRAGTTPLAVLLLALAVPAQPAIDMPHLFPRGARATGVATARFDPAQSAYLWTLRDLSGRVLIEYRLPIGHAFVQRGVLRIEETVTGVVPIAAGGLWFRASGVPAAGLGRLIAPYDLAFSSTHDPNHDGTLVSHRLVPGTQAVELRIRDTYRAGTTAYTCEKTFTLTLFGRALQITARSDPSVRRAADFDYAGFTFGAGEGLPAGGRALHVPYMDMVPVFVGGGVCVARWLDWYRSSASDTTHTPPSVSGSQFAGETGSGTYRNELGDLLAPIHEVAYVVVSDRIADTFPVIDRPPSEYRLHTAERAVSQNAPGNRYDKASAWVQRCADCGVDAMLHIKWDWSKWPFNLNDPDYLPAAPAPPIGTVFGSIAEWRAYADAAATAGWGLMPYFAANMMDSGYPNLTLNLPNSAAGSVLLTPNPAYDVTQCTRDAAGNLKKGWDTNLNLAGSNLAGQGHPVDVATPSGYAARFASFGRAIRGAQGFPTGGAHIDAQTEVPGWIEIDQISTSGRAKTIAENLRQREIAFQALKDGMQGPLMGENSHWRYRAFESYAAGLLDGTSRKIPIHWSPAQGPPNAVNWDAAVIPDFELGTVLPKATGWFGMGWESHYRGSTYPIPQSWSDGWHTTLLSYGHAPFLGTNGDVPNNYWNWRDSLRSLHLTRGLAAALRASEVREVRYVDGSGAELDLDGALTAGLDLAHPRLVLRCADGTEFKANHAAGNWTTTVRGRPVTLPPDGFAGSSPNGRWALSAINPANGQRVDYAFEPGVMEMIDRRGVDQQLLGFPGALLPVPSGLFSTPVDDKQMTIVHDLRRNQVVYATGFLTARRSMGPAPTIVSLRVAADDTTTMSLGRMRLGLRALARDSSGAERDVSGQVAWSSSHPSRVEVSRMGGLIARNVGDATITATWSGLTGSLGVRVQVEPVVGAPAVLAQNARATQVAVTTDTHAAVVFLVERVGATGQVWAFAVGDPADKRHVVTLTGLVSQAYYDLTPVAVNAFGWPGVGPKLRIQAQ